jgi:hypothetical protein
MRYDRARKNLDRRTNYILAAYDAGRAWPRSLASAAAIWSKVGLAGQPKSSPGVQ